MIHSNLFDITYSRRIPLLCTFELNRRCNLSCRHCYITDRSRRGELNTARVKKALVQLARAGTLSLVFTGGEIFLREDIFELIEFARKLRFDLRLFTNGTLIDDAAARRLASAGVSAVEISLYGRKTTHDNITLAPGSFDKAVRAVELLRARGVKVVLKTPLTKLNYRDFGWLKRFAKKAGARIQADAVVTPKDDGDKSSSLKFRLPYKTIGKLYAAEKSANRPLNTENAAFNLLCSAGHNLVAIRSDGNVYPCLQLPAPLGNIKRTAFSKIWSGRNIKTSRYLGIKPEELTACFSCKLASKCQRCPGLALLEENDLLAPSKTACKIAEITQNRN
jgi:AdoMet-dependent heme synthase